MDSKSRVRRESQARFREKLGLKCPCLLDCFEYFEANASTYKRRCRCFHLHHQNEKTNSFIPYNELTF